MRSLRLGWLPLAAGVVAILLWQSLFWAHAPMLDGSYRQLSSIGMLDQGRFVYFAYYLGLFPVTSTQEELTYSREGARRVLQEHGDTLQDEWGATIRSGDRGKILPYLLGAAIKGTAREPTLRPFHALLFVLALVSLWGALGRAGRPILGGLLVAVLGSHAMQVFETYAHENVFSLPISTALLVMALHVPLLGEAKPGWLYLWVAPLATGVLLGTIRQIRTEPALIGAAAGAVYLAATCLSRGRRLALVGLLAASFLASSAAWSLYFDHKVAEAARVVRVAGGHPFPGPRDRFHDFWHPIWCGLGDFGQDRGFAWDDRVAVRRIRPILERDYGVELPAWDGSFVATHGAYMYPEQFHDQEGRYGRLLFELPHYDTAVRRDVLEAVAQDPLWYAGILGQRLRWAMANTVPLRLAWAGAQWQTPLSGLPYLVLVLALALLRSRFLLKLLLFPLSLILPAVLIYSGWGTTFYGIHHLLAPVALAAWVAEAGVSWIRRRWPAGKRRRRA